MRVSRGNVALGLDDAEVIEQSRPLRKRGVALVLEGAAFPVWVNVAQNLLVLFCDGESIAVSLINSIQLLDHPIHRVFGKDRRAAIAGGLVPREQCIRVDVDAHVAQDVVQHIGAAQNHLILLVRAVALRGEQRALGVYRGLCVQQAGADARGALVQVTEVFLRVAVFFFCLDCFHIDSLLSELTL
ncbi:hypothetical protein SDC9_148375 [bioreactor metagenome]|uniref:Uncharacterized protein n=1 Tax=bioreactor metagenome TaxID=1076179 RepID=A0A645EJ51_9ZZZZ